MATKTLNEAAEDAIKNLDTFWMVGVVEQYQGFMAVLQSMMDPLKRCVFYLPSEIRQRSILAIYLPPCCR